MWLSLIAALQEVELRWRRRCYQRQDCIENMIIERPLRRV